MESRTVIEDIRQFLETFCYKQEFAHSSILVTGATGFLGASIIKYLLALDGTIGIIAPVRNQQKLSSSLRDERVSVIECDLMTFDFSSLGHVDYVIHCAAPTNSKYFVTNPVETFTSIVNISQHLLEYATRTKVKSFVYLSSLEVYGVIHDDMVPLVESKLGYLDVLDVRSSYPMAKRAVENLCHLYSRQYGLNVSIARLTQVTGAGIARDDNRVIAQFARLAYQGKDIILHTEGISARSYLYVSDAVSAILTLLIKGVSGEAYNIASENNYISVRDLALFVKDTFADNIDARIELKKDMGYAPFTRHNLSTKKLASLGWRPRYDLHSIFVRLFKYFEELDHEGTN